MDSAGRPMQAIAVDCSLARAVSPSEWPVLDHSDVLIALVSERGGGPAQWRGRRRRRRHSLAIQLLALDLGIRGPLGVGWRAASIATRRTSVAGRQPSSVELGRWVGWRAGCDV